MSDDTATETNLIAFPHLDAAELAAQAIADLIEGKDQPARQLNTASG